MKQYKEMMLSPDYAYDGSREWAATVRKVNRACPGYWHVDIESSYSHSTKTKNGIDTAAGDRSGRRSNLFGHQVHDERQPKSPYKVGRAPVASDAEEFDAHLNSPRSRL